MVNKYYSRLNLPHPPTSEILDLETIRSNGNICPTANIDTKKESIFAVYDVTPELHSLYQSYFDYDIFMRWQVVTEDLPLHYDWGISPDKYLYLLDTGGDHVTTKFYSELQDDPIEGGSFSTEGRTLEYEIHETTKTWFRINVKTPHQVVGITRPRVALIIRPVE